MFTDTPGAQPVDLEALIIDTARLASADGRLTTCAVTWLAACHDLIDGRRLSERSRHLDTRTSAYLGALLSWAMTGGGPGEPADVALRSKFAATLKHCRRLRAPRAFYDRIERVAANREWVRARSMPLFTRWGLWHDDATLKPHSLRSQHQILTVPELRIRALCSPSLESACLAQTLNRVTNARALSRELGATYAATHAAVQRLVGRGLLQRQRQGVKLELRLTPLLLVALGALP